MPAAYTHYLIASEVFHRLPERIKCSVLSPRLYVFGAQGADFCFLYRALNPAELNFGRFLHGNGGLPFFNVLALFAAQDPVLFSYALGYITHYAADCVFHPYVYYVSGNSRLKHSRTEGALDAHFRKSMPRRHTEPFNAALTEKERNSLFTLYAATAAHTDRAPLQKNAFFKALSAYRTYVSVYAKTVEKACPALLNGERKPWHYPKDERIIKTDGADELFRRAVTDSIKLIADFCTCLREGAALPSALFGKNFLSGL
ncbi:MAG: zinc dependent phospholipase C family protein [Clostridia bacterium]|nr:zinc dependent phospholipase C family protein [Clostridia bacterium]